MNRHLKGLALLLLTAACAHSESSDSSSTRQKDETSTTARAPSPGGPTDRLAPSSRERLAQALRSKGFLDAKAPPGTQLGKSIRKFQRSEGLAETGFPDRETLTRLGIDPKDVDRSLDPAPEVREGATGAGVSH
jgi:hypothetical protein